SALNLFGDITLAASSQQFGGFSTQNVDYIFAPYAEKTYNSKLEYYKNKKLSNELAKELAEEDTLSAIKQGIQGYEFKTSTVSNALGQIPFTSIGFGLDTSKWGRAITDAILTERSKPESTFVFPKLIFASSKDINLEPGTPNYDLFQKAVECSSRKLYPDYVSMDEGILAPAFNRHKDDPSQYLSVPMGCRSYNANAFINP
ncbi:anaerobic ribonucleoside-triphosphate reductase, partial [Enterorhabdus sp. P55]|uniref:anaerobic ribonucleoside-triphosphate reductase n=1 Tax=Enterorhabdus sp. P55 TaxID=2304571 RepID=UPI001428DB9C